MTDYPLPEGAELVSDRLIAGRYRIIHFPASGRYALLQKDGLIRIIPPHHQQHTHGEKQCLKTTYTQPCCGSAA